MGSDLQVSSIVHTVDDTFICNIIIINNKIFYIEKLFKQKAYTCNKIVAFYIIVLEVL